MARLSAGADVTRQAISMHLHVMADAGLVRATRRGRENVWELAPARLDDARRCLEVISRQWDDALARLASKVEAVD